MRRARRLLRLLAAVVAALLVAVVALLLATQTPWFKSWLRQLAVRQANQFLNGALSIGRLDGTLFSGVTLESVGVAMADGEAIHIDSIAVKYDVFEMLSKGVSIARLEVRRPAVTLVRGDDGWNLGHLLKPRPPRDETGGPRRPILLQRIEIVDGSVVIRGEVPAGAVRLPRRFDHINAVLALGNQADRWVYDIDRIAFQTRDPAIELRELSGSVAYDDRQVALRNLALRTAASSLAIDGTIERHAEHPAIDLAVLSDKLVLQELAPIVPRLASVTLEPSFEVKVHGPADRLAIDLNVRAAAWRVSGGLLTDLTQPRQSLTGDLSLDRFDLMTIIHNPDAKTDITGRSRFELRGEPLGDRDTWRWTATLDGPHEEAFGFAADDVSARAEIDGPRITFSGQARGYGTEATGTGFVVLKSETRPLTYAVRGVAHHVDLRRLPERLHVPAAASDINASYDVRGFSSPSGAPERKEVVASGRFEDSTVAGTQIAPGSTGGMTYRDGLFTYQADATVARLDLQRIGAGFDLGPLQRDRFASVINGHVVTSGQWTSARDLSLTATGTIDSSAIPGARVGDLAFTADLGGDSLTFTAKGHADGVDLKTILAPAAVEGRVAGSFDVRSTMTAVSRGVSLDRLDVSGRVELEDSRIGSVAIDRAAVDGDYHPSGASIRAFEASGPALSARGQGTLALDDDGQSNFTFQAESDDLTELGKLLQQPFAGSGRIAGTVTGNRRALTVAGHLDANEAKYADAGALVVDADYSARVLALRAAEVSVSATTKATFVSVAGQTINELQARLEYADQQLTFDADARQPNRSLSAAGTAAIAPAFQHSGIRSLEFT